jgi:hypothetical protein
LKRAAEAEALAERRLEMRNQSVRENDKWRLWAGETGGRPDSNEHDQELRALVHDRLDDLRATIKDRDALIAGMTAQKARDAECIADLRELLEFKRQEIASLNRDLLKFAGPVMS